MFKSGNKYENTNFIQIFNLQDDMVCMKSLCMYVVPLYVFTEKIPSTLHLSKMISSQQKATLSFTSRQIRIALFQTALQSIDSSIIKY